MGRQLDQLPTDATSLARKVARLERDMRELRASRRLAAATAGLIQTAASGARIALDGDGPALLMYSDDGTVIARLGPDEEDGGAGFWVRGSQEPWPLLAYLYGGELRWRPVDEDAVVEGASAVYDTDANAYADLILSSGKVFSGDVPAQVVLTTDSGGGPPHAAVHAILQADNWAIGQTVITPTASNTPTSAGITGLGLKGSTFFGYATPSTASPGTAVTGVGMTAVTANSATLWFTRAGTPVATTVYWMVIGQ
ncbi:hypothetical protein [Streptomyces sp. NPDC048445]|uniref:hypothetical protein n=1 Tax=Streptomyces sp. NPDC048445 TaxID=3365553 RepID=UPI003718421B